MFIHHHQTAIIYDSPVTGTIKRIAYGQLLDQVERCAGSLQGLGVGKGDSVVIYMPMVGTSHAYL